MTKRRKIFFPLISLAGIFLCLLAILLVLTPRLINLETVKKDIKNRYAANTGGEIEYRRINLAFFPRPHVVISAVNFTTPDHVSGTADSLKIYPRILPLFTGEIQIGAVHSSAPEITVRLPATPKEQSTSATPFAIETISSHRGSQTPAPEN